MATIRKVNIEVTPERKSMEISKRDLNVYQSISFPFVDLILYEAKSALITSCVRLSSFSRHQLNACVVRSYEDIAVNFMSCPRLTWIYVFIQSLTQRIAHKIILIKYHSHVICFNQADLFSETHWIKTTLITSVVTLLTNLMAIMIFIKEFLIIKFN